MSTLRKRWQLHTPAGAAPILDGSRFGFSRSWAPQGAGSLTLPLDDPAAAALVEHDRRPLRLVGELWCHEPAGPLAGGAFTGATLGTSTWPAEPLVHYPGGMVDDGGAPCTHKRVAWHVWPGRISRDHVARTLTVEVATVELRLVETINAGAPWLPAPTVQGGVYRLSDVLAQLVAFLLIPLTVDVDDATVPAELVQPWQPGVSAWDWFEGLRAAAFRSYRYDPTHNRLRFVPATDAAVGAVPADWLEWGDVAGGGAQEQLRYADALVVEWTWTDAAGEQHVDDELALAPGLTHWRDARALLRIVQHSKPIPGLAAHIVRQLARWRHLSTVVTPLDEHSLVDLDTGRGATAQAIEYALDDAPTVTFTLNTEGLS